MNEHNHERTLVRHNTISRKSVLKQSRRSESFESLEQPHAPRRHHTANASLLSSPYNSVDASSVVEKPTYRVSLLTHTPCSLSSSTRRG